MKDEGDEGPRRRSGGPPRIAHRAALILLASSLLFVPVRSALYEYCYRFVGIPARRIGSGRHYSCKLKSDLKTGSDGLVSYGLHVGREDVLNCNDASADIAGGWRTPCSQTTLDIPRGTNFSDFGECAFPPGLPDDDGSNCTFECYLNHLTNRFCGIVNNDRRTCAWKEAVLSVQIPGRPTCTWLQMSPGPCGGAVDPPDLSPSEVTDDFLNRQNAAINDIAFCPLADVANASSSDGVGEVTVRFYRRIPRAPYRGEMVESIVLDGHRVGYGAIPGYYGSHDGGAVLGYWNGEVVVAQRRGGEVCIAYEYMERTRITEPYFGTCRETCVQIDGEHKNIARRQGAMTYSNIWVSLRVEATSGTVPSGAEDDGSGGSSGLMPSLPPLLTIALVFNALIFLIS